MRPFIFLAILLLIASPLLSEEGKEAECLRQGAEYLSARNYEKAVKTFVQAARLNPDSVEAHRGMGMAYFKMGSGETATNPEMLGNAAAAFREALRIAPDSAEVRYHLGLVCLALDDRKGAMREYEELKQLDAKKAEQLRARIASYTPPASFRMAKSRDSGSNQTRVTIAGNAVFVPVTLSHGGKTVEATLILDTGASVTLITREIAEKLDIDLNHAARTRAQVAGGGMIAVWHAKVDEVTAGPHTKDHLDVAVVSQKGGGVSYDGLLGMNFLRNFKYHIDFSSQTIEWMP